MLAHLVLAAALVGAPPAPLATIPASPDTFEIRLAAHVTPASGRNAIHIVADDLEYAPWGGVVLRLEGRPVAIFQVHQVVAVVSRSVLGERTFEVIPQQGEVMTLTADRMMPMQNNVVLFYRDDRLTGVAGQGGAQLVLDKGALVGADRSGRVRPLDEGGR